MNLGHVLIALAILHLAFVLKRFLKEKTMPVSQDVQDFCGQLGPRVQAKVDAAVTAALASASSDAQAAQDKAVADALGQVQQDHADEVAALKAALDAATGPDAGAA